jgi:hypothetical protein
MFRTIRGNGTCEQNEYRKNPKTNFIHYQPREKRSTGCPMRRWEENMRL